MRRISHSSGCAILVTNHSLVRSHPDHSVDPIRDSSDNQTSSHNKPSLPLPCLGASWARRASDTRLHFARIESATNAYQPSGLRIHIMKSPRISCRTVGPLRPTSLTSASTATVGHDAGQVDLPFPLYGFN
ncbi:unnamed protein product [Protopolystoma xenopodis]|uniref:Uncharacterized protein n=1 Tax=Protopolystoma xenopodis TaxID=117903 RepID=A0A448XNL1_9PLAT|nr:unnamed protein product [Protopolystoma xenopodis]